ncbi:MAG TPA: bis(5'-nucleosyl)-tetraphosphatase (symmetrical) YqeK [Bacilli bacterium]|nr:bis(5'-nucleosyl)-tetraphosphatase (symmetrical) YqeK [Bacilli bacterium]HQM17991.1 bis(5'-nucleosyl)-tetraphosphatase (symmetrical) YqeK [Bacilli bacterium]
MIKIDKITEQLKKRLNEKDDDRYLHSLRTVEMAERIVFKNKIAIDLEKVKLTALIHDYCKNVSKDEFLEIIKKYNLDLDFYKKTNFKIWHALLAPYIIEVELGIKDQEILNAVKYHTTGYNEMSDLDFIIYLADLTEDERPYPEASLLRALAYQDYKKAAVLTCYYQMQVLEKMKLEIHPYTLGMYNSYKYLLKEDNLENLVKVKDILEGIKLQNIKIYDVRGSTPLYDYAIVATASSSRQMQAVPLHLKKEASFGIRGVEGPGDSSWVLIDLNSIIVHVFSKDQRELYALDQIWEDLPKLLEKEVK